MFASLNQNWLSAKYHRTTNLTCCDRSVSYVIQRTEGVKRVGLALRPYFATGARARFLDLVFGECK